VSALAIRRLSRRFSARGGVLVAVVAVSGAIAMHHSVVSAGDLHHGGAMAAAVELCLGVMAAGAAVVAIAIGVLGLGRWRPPEILAANGLAAALRSPIPRVRAGPSLLSLLCVRRR
jgi:hypothetical protein